MSAQVAAIYRFPVKGLGQEALESVALEAGRHVPGDRVWALAHAASDWDPETRAWTKRKNFVQTAHAPELARLATTLHGEAVTVTAPDREPITARPDDPGEAALLAAWLEGVAGHRQPGPYRVARRREGALTDVEDAHVSILSDASLRALSEKAGRPLERRRFRGNLWIEGLAPWAEFESVGREIAIGPVRLRITERIGRCNATTASPATGQRDTPVLDLLREGWGHTDFGVYAQVVTAGPVAVGDAVGA